MLFRPILAATFALGAAFLSSPARAQSTEKTFQVGLVTPFVVYSKQTFDIDDSNEEYQTSGVGWGLRNGLSGEFGYGLTDALILGGIAQIGGSSDETESPLTGAEVETSNVTVSIGPKLDFMFLPRSKYRPFVGAVAGLLYTSSDAGALEISSFGFQGTLRGGVRWFIAERMSIDPALAFSFNFGSGDLELGNLDADASSSGFSIGLALGFSGWI